MLLALDHKVPGLSPAGGGIYLISLLEPFIITISNIERQIKHIEPLPELQKDTFKLSFKLLCVECQPF